MVSSLRSKRFLMLGLGALALAVVMGLLWLAYSTPATNTNAGQELETAMQDRAAALVHANYAGAIDAIHVQESTIGATRKVDCGALGRWLSLMTESLRGRPNWCLSDTRVWIITLRGNFHKDGFRSDTLTVMLDASGAPISLDSGALVQASW